MSSLALRRSSSSSCSCTMHQIRFLRRIPATSGLPSPHPPRSTTLSHSRRGLVTFGSSSSPAKSLYPTCEVIPVKCFNRLLFRIADVSLVPAFNPTNRVAISPLSFPFTSRHLHTRAGMAANGTRSISSTPTNSSLRQRQKNGGKEAAHDHDHGHSHEHSHSLFGHSHSHGEEGHSHDAEQIVAALEGSGALSLAFDSLPTSDRLLQETGAAESR